MMNVCASIRRRAEGPLPPLCAMLSRTDRAMDLKRLMSEMNRPDRELQSQMPIGESLEVTLSQKKLLLLH